MKKLFVSLFMLVAVAGTSVVLAQGETKTCCKKTECTKSEDKKCCKEDKKCCKDEKKCSNKDASAKKCCSEKKADDKSCGKK